MRHHRNPDEDLRDLERRWKLDPANTQLSRSYFRAKARAGLLPDVSSTEPDNFPGREEQIRSLSDLFELIDTPDVEQVSARIEDLHEYAAIADLEALVGPGERARTASFFWNVTRALRKRLTKGDYDEALAVRGYLNVVERAAQVEGSLLGGRPWHVVYPVALRRHFAEWLTRRFESRWGAGLYKDWPISKTGGLKRAELEKPKKPNSDEDLRELEKTVREDPYDHAAVMRLVRAACRIRDYKLAWMAIEELVEQRRTAERDESKAGDALGFGDDPMADQAYSEAYYRRVAAVDAIGEALKLLPSEAWSTEHKNLGIGNPKTKNPDEERRRRERLATPGDVASQVRVLADKLRTGTIDEWFVRAAATMGHPAALELAEPFDPYDAPSSDLPWNYGEESTRYGLRAHDEGWDIFESDTYGLQIQALDEPREGGRAWRGPDRETRLNAWLVKRVRAGDRMAITALLIVRQDLGLEYMMIMYPGLFGVLEKKGVGPTEYWAEEVAPEIMDRIRAKAHEVELSIADSFLGLGKRGKS